MLEIWSRNWYCLNIKSNFGCSYTVDKTFLYISDICYIVFKISVAKYMYVSILIPTFNRRRFSELITHNILNQTYPFVKEVIVADDGYDDERLNLKLPC